MLFEDSYVILHEDFFVRHERFKKPQFIWTTLPYINQFLNYPGVRDGIYYMIFCDKYRNIIEQVIEKYELQIEIIDTEEEAKALGDIQYCKYYKPKETNQDYISLNPVEAQSLHAVFQDIVRQQL